MDPVLIQIATEIAQTVRGQVHEELYELLITRIAKALDAERDHRPLPQQYVRQVSTPRLDYSGLADLDRRCGPFVQIRVYR